MILLLATILAAVYLYMVNDTTGDSTKKQTYKPGYSNCLKAEGNSKCLLKFELADTTAKMEQGLSDRMHMAKNEAMLFAFSKETLQCFWMKDMKFSLDFVWLNENKEVVDITRNVSPDSYPNEYCQEQVKYVIEINNGEANNLGLSIGQKLIF